MAGSEGKQSNAKASGGEYINYTSSMHTNATVPNFMSIMIPGGKKKEVKKETGLGLSHKKDENFGEWYSEVS